MSRPLWLGLGLILLSNAVALAGVWYNRSGEPQALLQLGERELRVPYDGWLRGEENSALRLQLVWRQPQERQGWLDEITLRELGFDPLRLGHGSVRPVWLVLEQDGPAYHKLLEEAQSEFVSAESALLKQPQDKTLQRQRDDSQRDLLSEQTLASRLVMVDIGLDAEALRRAWPDRQQYVVLPARITPYQSGARPTYSASVALESERISVPRNMREVFAGWRQRGYYEPGPRVQVEVAFGQRHEPWMISARQ